MPNASTGPGPKRAGQPRRDLRAGRDRERHRQEREPGLDRRVAEHLLQVERQEVPHGEHRGAEAEDHEVRRRSARASGRSAAARAARRRSGPRSARRPPAARGRRASVSERPRRAPAVRRRSRRSRRSSDDEAGRRRSARPRGRSRAPRRRRARPRATMRSAASAAAIPIGTLMKQDPAPAQRLRSACRRAARPTRRRSPPIAPQSPSARLRSAPSVNVVVRIDSVAGATTAPPRPWTARAAISVRSVCARPPASDASANSTQPGREDLAPPEQVGRAAAEQQEAGEGQRVGVDDPLQARRP